MPAMRRALGRVLRTQRFDVVNLEFSWSAEPSNQPTVEFHRLGYFEAP